MTEAQKIRRKSALGRLKLQLENGVKPSKETKELIPLTEKDIVRINKEITVLSN